jgi:microcystin degradation protein MlrC
MPGLFVVLALLATFSDEASAQSRRFRVAVGGLSAESNSLYPRKNLMIETDGATVSREKWLAEAAKDSDVAGGIVAAAPAAGLEIYPVLRARAGFLGSVEKTSFEAKADELVRQIRDAQPPYEGVILVQHGAMVVDGYPHGDAEVARRVRVAMGKGFPIIVTQDFHANVSEDLVALTEAVITYKENPHLDTRERGIQAAQLMGRILRREVRPVQAIAKPAMIVNIVYQNTFAPPYKPITDESRRLERVNPKVLAVSVPGGYQWADVPAMGPSAIVVTDNDPELARREARRLADLLWRLRDKLVLKVPDVSDAVRMAMSARKFPVVLMDTGDNIGGGSAGDATFILAELLRQKAEGWVVTISDREANEAAFRIGVAGAFDMAVGGKTDKLHGDPIRVTGRVKSLHDGRYYEPEVRHGGSHFHDMGPTAVIEVEGSRPDLKNLLLLTRRPTSPNSIHQIASNGVYPARQRILVAKGTTAPRAAYEPVAAAIIEVNTPGATDVNPKRFNFQHIRRPLFGVD